MTADRPGRPPQRDEDPGSERARCWDRIERGRPATWLEANAVRGRERLFSLVRARLGDVAGRRILDLGCGRGTLLRALAAAGARATGIDRRTAALADLEAEAPEVETIAGELPGALADLARAGRRFDDVLALELFEELDTALWPELARGVAELSPRRLIVAARTASLGSAALAATGWPGPSETIDPVALLRVLHLETELRLTHRETIAARTYHAELYELA